MRKIGALFVLVALFVNLLPGIALAGGGVPAGLTLQAWGVFPNEGGKDTMINFLYSGGFSTALEIETPYDSSWHKLDDVRPILEAYKEGYGPNLGSTGGIMGTTISFAPNVLAAMKVQNFNPSQVGGADIPPSSTTLNSSQTAWLQKVGYSADSTSQPASTPDPTPTPPSVPQTQSQPQPSQQTSSTNSTSVQQGKANTSTPTTDPAVGQTVKTPSGPMTQEMAAKAQQLAAENPPSLNPANIPINIPANAKKSTSLLKNIWVWVGAGTVILVLAAVVARIIYVKRQA